MTTVTKKSNTTQAGTFASNNKGKSYWMESDANGNILFVDSQDPTVIANATAV